MSRFAEFGSLISGFPESDGIDLLNFLLPCVELSSFCILELPIFDHEFPSVEQGRQILLVEIFSASCHVLVLYCVYGLQEFTVINS